MGGPGAGIVRTRESPDLHRPEHARAVAGDPLIAFGASGFLRHRDSARSNIRAVPGAGRDFRHRDPLHFDPGRSFDSIPQALCRLVGEVNNSVPVERAPVIDADDHRAAVFQIGDAGVARKLHGLMGCGDRIHVEDFAIRCLLAVELLAVPGGDAALTHRFVTGDRDIVTAEHGVRPVGAAGRFLDPGHRTLLGDGGGRAGSGRRKNLRAAG